MVSFVCSYSLFFRKGPLILSSEVAQRLHLSPESAESKEHGIIVTLVDLPSGQFARLKVDRSDLHEVLDLQVKLTRTPHRPTTSPSKLHRLSTKRLPCCHVVFSVMSRFP